jgi:hypothetical protein
MIIDKKLNLIVAVSRDDETTVYIHSTPIRLETFRTYHLVLSKTFASLMSEKLSIIAGPSVAAYVLEEVAKTTNRSPGVNWWEGPDGVENGLMAEIRRLSNIITLKPDGSGWGALPLQLVLDDRNRDGSLKVMSEEEAIEVMNQLVFFTVISSAAPRKDRPSMIHGAAYLFDGQTSLLDCTAFAASLKILTPVGSTGEKPTL